MTPSACWTWGLLPSVKVRSVNLFNWLCPHQSIPLIAFHFLSLAVLASIVLLFAGDSNKPGKVDYRVKNVRPRGATPHYASPEQLRALQLAIEGVEPDHPGVYYILICAGNACSLFIQETFYGVRAKQ